MNGETVVTVVLIVFVIGMFTDFFGLGTVIVNRGSWYTVMPDELETVMTRLHEMNAFKDSDGIPQNAVKIKAHYIDAETRYYRVKVPDWVFKYRKAKIDDETKAELLGIKLK